MKKSQKFWLALSLLFTLVAMGFHYYLTQKYFALKFSTAEGISACNLTSFLNCDAVSASSYASFLGRPLALWGLVTNLLFFFVQLAVLWNWFSNSRRGFLLTFLFATVLGTASLIMGIISLTMLSQLCLYCTATYALSWISLGIWTGLTQPKISEIFSFFRGIPTQKSTLGIAVAIPFLTWIFNTFFLDLHGANNVNFERIVQERLAAWHAAPKNVFDLNTGLKIGTPNSRFTIVEFADFRCPHCKTAYPSLHAFAQAHPETQLVFKPYPLDGSCNSEPNFKGEGDGISCRLALGSLCADKIQKKASDQNQDHSQGWAFHHFLFDQQESIRNIRTTSKLDEKMCSSNLVDCQQLTNCMNSNDTMNELKGMIQEAIRANLTGTPTIFVNGQLLGGGQLLPVLEGAYLQAK
ncbi:MAG: DsbA family protein [Bdellovibrionaceae bacterium]|nr:DsbA family protein [Pseudobdellovibrionaceae bacterium]